MKKLLLLLACHSIILISFAQDKLVYGDQNVRKAIITRMHYDTLSVIVGTIETDITFREFRNLNTSDQFKKFLYENPQVYDSDDIPLAYTNYCLDKYRKQSNTGRSLMLAGSLTAIGSVVSGNEDLTLVGGIAGGALILAGYIVDWSSLHWLKNVHPTGEYKVGLGYIFTF